MRGVALVLLAALALAGCGGDEGAAPDVVDLENILFLRSDFEAEAGKTRVLLLFSPT